jgi:hypothetical protein
MVRQHIVGNPSLVITQFIGGLNALLTDTVGQAIMAGMLQQPSEALHVRWGQFQSRRLRQVQRSPLSINTVS